MNIPNEISIIRNGTIYFARIKDLPGCMTQADNWIDLEKMIYDAKLSWIQSALERGDLSLIES
jgi:predicted RNase H-like HicB family nuclease